MKKALVGFIMDGKSGGIDKYLLNFLEKAKKEGEQIDFLTNEIDKELKAYLEKKGSKIYAIANLKHPVKQYRQVCALIHENKYDTVYLNISTAIDCITAFAAKKCKVPRRMIHSHSSGNDIENIVKRKIFDFLHRVGKIWLYKSGTHFFACSRKAGMWLFPKKIVEGQAFQVVFNAVDKKKFTFSEKIRSRVRKKMKLENKYVIGHVGNFCYQKNHEFLIRIGKELVQKDVEIVMLLIGQGVLFEKIKRQIEVAGFEDKIRLLGQRADVYELMQAMDMFLLPSNFEGLPTVGVEAQMTGLPCVFSDDITDEVEITNKCHFLSLKEESVWCDEILRLKEQYKKRSSAVFLGEENCYDISECSYPCI